MSTSEPALPIVEPINDDDSEEEEDNSQQPSGFKRITDDFAKLNALVLNIQDAFSSTSNNSETAAATATTNSDPPAATTTSDPASATSNSDPAAASNSNEITNGNSNINNASIPDAPAAAAAGTTSNGEEKAETMLKKDVRHIQKNVAYIKKHVDKLEISPFSERADELLQHLMDAANNRSAEDFIEHSDNLNHLLQIVAKLKNWVPPQPPEKSGNEKNATTNKKKKESPIVSKKDKDHAAAEIVKTLVSYDCEKWGMDGLLKSYGELEVRDKLCLLCFSVFLCDVDKVKNRSRNKDKDENNTVSDQKNKNEFVFVQKNLVIKKKVLIYWWVGEGFIDRNSVPQSNPSPDSDSDSQEISAPLLNLDSVNENPNSSIPTIEDIGGNTPTIQSNPSPDSNSVDENTPTIEDIGEKILNVLSEKGFIEPVIRRGRESGSYQMHPFVHSFITALAKRAGFFDFRKVNGKLSTRFTLSQRACLLKTQGDSLSSCRRWNEKIDDRAELKKFATVQTLFNVNESIIDIKPEWFSKMKYLSVLHLGSWRSEAGDHIEVDDPKFMEDLKSMKQLKLFSLQGVSTIMRLPDSVCKLSKLIILDLRECHNLEELPAGIGSLKNLTHLDITNCHLLTKLPIGISLLSKLEVLNGFVIDGNASERDSGWWKKTKGFVVHDMFRRDNKETCILRDLLKLGNLRELSIVVNRDNFPNLDEVNVFREMRKLCSLKISWVYDFESGSRDQTGSNQGDSETDKATGSNEGDSKTDKATGSNQGESQTDKATGSNQGESETDKATGSNQGERETDKATGSNQGDCETDKAHNGGCCGSGNKAEGVNNAQKDTNGESSQKEMKELEKLELLCFPREIAPNWLVPNQLKKLKKLYIKGGKLKSLKQAEAGNNITWEVEMLRLKYLCNLEISWRELKEMFPKMKYLEKYACKKMGLFPCDHEGVWQHKGKTIS